VRVLDRTALILDILPSTPTPAKACCRLNWPSYEYYLPRLTRQWTHLARQAGGGGGRSGSVGGVGLRGPGETQLEIDRREIRTQNHPPEEANWKKCAPTVSVIAPNASAAASRLWRWLDTPTLANRPC
jgi:hypothetical protein